MVSPLYYFQINIICMIILAIVYIVLKGKKSALPARRVIFNRILVLNLIICIADIGSWLFDGKTFAGAYYVVHFCNGLFDLCLTWIGYLWLTYVEIRTSTFESDTKKRRILEAIPLFIMVGFLVTNPITNWIFSVDETNTYSRGDFMFIHWLISWGYLIWATVKVIVSIRRSSSRFEKRELLPMIWFIVPPAVAAILQMIFYGITSTQCGITISILILIMTFLGNEISTDTLTGLNNRRAFDNYLNDEIERGSLNPTILMCDVNNFKTINDTLGHSTGDLVLKKIAAVLKTSCNQSPVNAFLFRYGGDEFVICGLSLSAYESQNLIDTIKRNLEEANNRAKDNLHLSISIGEASGICSTIEEVEMLISVADADMYKNKQAFKAASVLAKTE